MEFHQQHCVESMRDKMINALFENNAFKEEFTMEHIKNMIPWDNINCGGEIDSDSSDDEPEIKEDVVEKPFSDSISDDNDSDDNDSDDNDSDDNESNDNESVTDITEEPVTEITKKDKKSKKKKEKKESTPSNNTDDKPKRAKPSFVYFKSHPDVKDAIEEASKQLQGENDKKPGEPLGKVKGAGIVWGNLSAEEKDVWKQRSLEEFKQTLNQ